MERWNLGWDRLQAANPDIVVLRVSGFGQTGPYAQRAAFGTVMEAMSGFAAVTGEPDGPPTLPPFGLADYIAGVTGAAAVSMALYDRKTNGGGGQEIDLSLLMPILGSVGIGPAIFQTTGRLQPRYGNLGDGGTAPRNMYQTADGQWVALSASAPAVAERVMNLVGHPEVIPEPWFETNAGRWDHVEELDAYVGDWIRARTREDVVQQFSAAGAAVGPVYTAEDILADAHIQESEMLVHFEDADIGDVVQTAPLFKMSKTPGSIRFLGTDAASAAKEILEDELGLSSTDLEQLRVDGVIA
jgi:crotonobetainyl-CoA:carnitine CoA-transferase CaiB-like acyl-CoA transferase